ncbi:ATP-binding protein, partial [Rhodospirillum rubrum]|nr:ATP-binding protein [Rhodospirillum rubrum]
ARLPDRRPLTPTTRDILDSVDRALPAGTAANTLTAGTAANDSGAPTGDGAPPVAAVVETPPSRLDELLREVLSDPDAAFRNEAVLYQDFLVRCRLRGVNGRMLDLGAFRRRLAVARAGVDPAACSDDPDWQRAQTAADALPEDLRAIYLLLARAARDGAPCPSDLAIARARGSRSPRRGRGLLEYLEGQGAIGIREDAYGLRVVSLTALDWETAPGTPEDAEAGQGDLFGLG